MQFFISIILQKKKKHNYVSSYNAHNDLAEWGPEAGGAAESNETTRHHPLSWKEVWNLGCY